VNAGQDCVNQIEITKCKKIHTLLWSPLVSLALVLILITQGVVVILQGVTVSHLNTPSVVCPETTPDALTSDSNNINTACNEELLIQINRLINMTQAFSNDEMEYIQNNTDMLQRLLEAVHGSAQMLINITDALSKLKNIEEVISDMIQELLEIQNGSLLFSSHHPISCQEIKTKKPNSPSGYYHVNSRDIYCNMGELCDSEGGWTRLAYLNMSDSTENCPSGFRLYETRGVRACGRPNGGPSCASVTFPSNGISYSEVCGRVVGYRPILTAL